MSKQMRPAHFRVHAGEPVVVDITTKDGREFVGRIAPAVLEVFEVVGEEAQGGTPQFEFRANMAVDIKPKEKDGS